MVTGSTSGIGEATARVLAASGATVVVSGRDQSRAERVVAAIADSGGSAYAVPVDLSAEYSDLRTFAREATAALDGRIDILVNNAGLYPVSPTEALADADLDAMLAVNVRAPHVLVGEIVPAMVTRASGVVINIGSWMARIGSPFG